MKRREFLKSSLGISGFMGLGTAGAVIQTALAEEQLINDVSRSDTDFELTDETINEDFNYQGHRVKIMRREFRRRRNFGKKSRNDASNRKERWIMTMDGKELPPHFFRRLESEGCYYSDLLPFLDKCQAQTLARELVEGHEMKLFDVLGQ